MASLSRANPRPNLLKLELVPQTALHLLAWWWKRQAGCRLDIVQRPSKGMGGATVQSDDWIVRLLDADVKRTQLEERKRRIIGWSTVRGMTRLRQRSGVF